MNITSSVALKSNHGVVKLEQSGLWNPFPKDTLVNVICEQNAVKISPRFKRQALTLTKTRECTLKKGVGPVGIGVHSYCLANMGTSVYSKAEDICKSQNAKLPVPRNAKENEDLMRALKLTGIDPSPTSPVILGITDSLKGNETGTFESNYRGPGFYPCI